MPKDKKRARFDTRKEVDFVIIGSGASGGILAKELSSAGFDVVVLEQGPYRTAKDFSHDEIDVMILGKMMEHPSWKDPQTFRASASEKASATEKPKPATPASKAVSKDSVKVTKKTAKKTNKKKVTKKPTPVKKAPSRTPGAKKVTREVTKKPTVKKATARKAGRTRKGIRLK